jgi:hypothetical protein
MKRKAATPKARKVIRRRLTGAQPQGELFRRLREAGFRG